MENERLESQLALAKNLAEAAADVCYAYKFGQLVSFEINRLKKAVPAFLDSLKTEDAK
jgi:hypothetical protein